MSKDTLTENKMSDAANPIGDGEAEFCDNCGEAYRHRSVLPGGIWNDYCPTCLEDYMSREKHD